MASLALMVLEGRALSLERGVHTLEGFAEGWVGP
jgi:hypothetical protein